MSNQQHPYYCYGCNLSFLAPSPRCPQCQGEFVEEIPANVATNLDLASTEDVGDGQLFAAVGAALGSLFGDMDSIVAESSISPQPPTNGPQSPTDTAPALHEQPTNPNNQQPNEPLFDREAMIAEMMRQFRESQVEHARRTGHEIPPLDPVFMRRHFENALQSHEDALRRELGNIERNGDQSAARNEDQTEQPHQHPQQEQQHQNPEVRTMRIPLGGGNELVIMVSANQMPSREEFHRMFPFIPMSPTSPAQTANEQQPTEQNNDSVLHPLLRLFGFAGDPRDYVNDPERFGELLDRLFHLSEGTTVGLSKKDIGNIPRLTLQHYAKLVEDGLAGNEICPVCMDPVSQPTIESSEPYDVIVLDCGHGFHEPCIIPWLERCATCPVCRDKVETERLDGSGVADDDDDHGRGDGFNDQQHDHATDDSQSAKENATKKAKNH